MDSLRHTLSGDIVFSRILIVVLPRFRFLKEIESKGNREEMQMLLPAFGSTREATMDVTPFNTNKSWIVVSFAFSQDEASKALESFRAKDLSATPNAQNIIYEKSVQKMEFLSRNSGSCLRFILFAVRRQNP